MTASAPHNYPAPEEYLETAIAAAGGDVWAAALALAAELDETKAELLLTRVAVSNGFSRGWHHRKQR